MKKILIFLTFFISLNTTKAQRFSTYGITTNYNFQSAGIGIDAKAFINIYSHLFINPRISYYPSFNEIHELYAGADLSWLIFKEKTLNPYLFVGGYYNKWLNSDDFKGDKATENNIAFEPGIGLLYKKNCLTPFIETRYDSKWNEFTIGIGVLIKFGECFRGRGFSHPNAFRPAGKQLDRPLY